MLTSYGVVDHLIKAVLSSWVSELGAKRPERSGFASIWMRSIQITEDKGAKRPSDQSEPKASGYGIVTSFSFSPLHFSVRYTVM